MYHYCENCNISSKVLSVCYLVSVYYGDRGHTELDPHIPNKSYDLDLDQQGQGEGHRDTWTGSHGNDTDWGPSISGIKQDNIDNERSEKMDQSESSALWDTADSGNQSKTVASWEADGEGDADFWGCEDVDLSQQVRVGSSTQCSDKQDLLQHSNDLCESVDTSCKMKIDNNKIVDDQRSNEQDCLTKSAETDLSLHTMNKLGVSKGQDTEKMEKPKILNSGDILSNAKDFSTNFGNEILDDFNSNDYDITEKGDSKQKSSWDQQNKNNIELLGPDARKHISEKIGDPEMSDTDKEVNVGETSNENATIINVECESREITPQILHPYCDTEDNDADYLVIDDSDTEAERGLRPVKPLNEVWKPVLKRDPFPVQEPLILSLEEVILLCVFSYDKYTTRTLISIKNLFLITGHTGNLTPKILL